MSRSSFPCRRDFLKTSVAAGAGAAALGGLPVLAAAATRARIGAGTPLIITSHTNATGAEAMRQAWEILAAGGSALDAVERGANVIEVDPDDHSVGYGGLPNEEGVVQLDASIMDGRTYSAGSVASIENIMTPSSVARLVMERTDHVMLVGPGALAFARSFGFKEENLLTEEAREIWIRWREQHSETDKWGPPEHLKGRLGTNRSDGRMRLPPEYEHGTTNVLAVDSNGDIAGITTTSGFAWKVPGRIGDSPIIGAGLYVDNSVGAAGATGRGEDVIKSCASYYIVLRMREGRSPQEACEDAIEMIVERYRAVGLDYIPGEKFVAVDKAGEYGCAQMGTDQPPRITFRHGAGLDLYAGSAHYGPSR
ncbi:MAG: N(4)-(beta-N-acetylglucosaminyl)-L-asparaginase [Longimicrobiales bacterium]|nr:N(4)-(beta-N-acetylglucosaminyl)-L-asparaginase [Longimicrobiales bacterium]